MLFAFDLRNFTLAKAIFFYFNFSAQEIELHFSFSSNFLICYIPPPVSSCVFFYFRKVAQIILSLFLWSLFCLLTLKLCFSDPTWQPVRPEFNSSPGRSAETTGTSQTGVSWTSVFRSYATCCDNSILLAPSCAYKFLMQNCEQGGLQAGSSQFVFSQTQLLRFHRQYNNRSVTAAVSRSLHCYRAHMLYSISKFLPCCCRNHAKASDPIPPKPIFHMWPQSSLKRVPPTHPDVPSFSNKSLL